jgi:predicted esterase
MLAALAFAPAASASAASPRLSARPEAVAETAFPVGLSRLPNDALLYRPPTLPPGRQPLVVLLHGGAGLSDAFLRRFEREADEAGFLLLALRSKGQSWDLIESAAGSESLSLGRGRKRGFGADVGRTDAVLRALFSKAAVDPAHVVVLGFSDGATYALALGLANPRLFGSIVALSPGFLVAPSRVDRQQRIFIAHADNDRVLPFQTTEDLVELLQAQGLKPVFRRHKSGHSVEQGSLEEGLRYALGRDAVSK